jgi:hypothetical protein
LHQRDCLAPAASVRIEEGVSAGRTAATQVGENEFIGKRVLPDESVPLLPPKGAPAEIADGTRRVPTKLGGFGLCSGLRGKRGRAAEAAPPQLLRVDWQIQVHFAFYGSVAVIVM